MSDRIHGHALKTLDSLYARIADLNGLMDMMRENAVDREKRIAELEAMLDVVVEDEIRASRGNWTAEAVLDRLRARAEAEQEEAP